MDLSQIKVRSHQDEDIPQLVKINESVANYSLLAGASEAIVQREKDFFQEEVLKGLAEKGQMLVAEESGKPIGFICFVENYIQTAAILPSYSDKGIGRKLVSKAEHFLAREQHEKIYLESTPFNLPFWEKMGYRKYEFVETNYRGFIYNMIKKLDLKKMMKKKGKGKKK